MKKVDVLRKKYPRFVYEGYYYKIFKNDGFSKFTTSLKIYFDFKISSNNSENSSRSKLDENCSRQICFKPEIIIKNIDKKRLSKIGTRILDNLIFHLGLMEIPSYWKTTCSPLIEIKAGYLDKEQIKWWKNLIINGMGQFFYENQIDFRRPNFLRITLNKRGMWRCLTSPECGDVKHRQNYQNCQKLKDRALIPIREGKDSIVTLELFKKFKKEIKCFSLNPFKAAEKVMKTGNCLEPVIARRKIDERLLELNRQGFLNGHTPFSAYLAFLSIMVAVLFDYKYIAFSNERSSNEGNVKYLGSVINHQWSKSFEFEKKFHFYSKKYLSKEVEYFSFLRPLYEIQIARLFSKFPRYFPVFLSCNEAYKTASGTKKPTGKWCGNCSKCLFVWTILYPFIEKSELIKIFKKNLFKDKNLIPIMKELIGESKIKPFECVGTKKECLIAFYLSYKKSIGDTYGNCDNLPVLLKYFQDKILPKYSKSKLEQDSKKILNSWNKQNNLPKDIDKILWKGYYK